MIGWIVYNSTLDTDKVKKSADIIAGEFRNYCEIHIVDRHELLAIIESYNKVSMKYAAKYPKPDFVFFRDKDYFMASYLEMAGVKVYNNSEAIRICDNKSLIHLKLSGLDIKIPKTIIGPLFYGEIAPSDLFIEQAFDTLGAPIVVKESCGAGGTRVYLSKNPKELISVLSNIKSRDFILQEYISTSYGRDTRINIVGLDIVGGMIRYSNSDFRSNIALGGKTIKTTLSQEQKEVALKVHTAIGLDISGVDILFGNENEPILCEINSNMEFLVFEETTGINLKKNIVDYIIGKTKSSIV